MVKTEGRENAEITLGHLKLRNSCTARDIMEEKFGNFEFRGLALNLVYCYTVLFFNSKKIHGRF